jgi:hypothetical protein
VRSVEHHTGHTVVVVSSRPLRWKEPYPRANDAWSGGGLHDC